MLDECHAEITSSKPRSDFGKLFHDEDSNRQVGPVVVVARIVRPNRRKQVAASTRTKIRTVAIRRGSTWRETERCCRIATSTWCKPRSGNMR